jgi:flagellar biosynthesis anti-sigma factor FlgM
MIDGLGGRLPPIVARAAATTAPVAEAARVKPARSDLSALATTVRDMAAAPPVDRTKVDSIKNTIDTGTYTISPTAVAERIIATDLRG